MPGVVEADVCIVGAGVAGLFAATALPDGLHVVVLDQGTVGQGSSPYAQGGMAAAVGPDDSPERHLADTVAAGAGLVDRRACAILCREVPDRVRDLLALGCGFDRNPDGTLHLAREGAQSVPRSVHRADATGAEMVRALRAAAAPRVERVEGYAFQLAVIEGRCVGVWAIGPEGPFPVRARATLLATGGAGALFASTTNPPASIGAAIALARSAGARLADLEFVQFHPTALAVPESPRPLLTEALRGAGAHLLDAEGLRFMLDVHPDAELAPRHVVTAAILARGRAFLDARHLGAERLEEEFPTVLESCRDRGLDPVTELLPVTPAAHYLIGGVVTDLEGRTSLSGLFAAGECAATGVHGANRMAGNSLAEAVVFGRRAAMAVAEDVRSARVVPGTGEPDLPAGGVGRPEEGWVERRRLIVEAVTEGAGPIRTGETARAALGRLARLDPGRPPADRDALEARTMVEAGRLLVRAALARAESRGVHARADHPEQDPSLDGVHLAW